MLSRENEYLLSIRDLCKERRIAMRFKQTEAASRSGVNISTLRHFEKTGKISLLNLLNLLVLYRMDRQFMSHLTDRSGWTIEQLERAEKFRSVR